MEMRGQQEADGGSAPATRDGARRGGWANWPLRAGLIVTFVVLVATSAVAEATRSPAPAATATTPPTVVTLPPTTTTNKTGTTTTGSTTPPTTTTVPGAFSGPVTSSTASGGCGFALAPPAASAGAAPRPVGRCTVLEVGDSLGADLGYGISDQLPVNSGLNMQLYDRASTGLANSWFFNWPVNLQTDLSKVHPQLVIVLLGGNDQQGMTVNGNVVSFPSPAWEKDYIDYIRQVTAEVTNTGAYLMWVGLPIMQPFSYNQGAAILNELYKEAVPSEPDATFVPVWSLLANPSGQFQMQAAVNGQETTLRSSDGIHFSFAGEAVLATYILREMAKIYHVALAPTSPSVVTSWG
jgi:hypothetical protein